MNGSRITILITAISILSVLNYIFIRNYNSPENIEKRCTSKFQKEFKKVYEKSEKEWNLNMDLADNNYLECIGIP